MECKFFHTLEGISGYAVMTNCYQFFVVADMSRPRDEIRVKKVADLPCKYSCNVVVLFCLSVHTIIKLRCIDETSIEVHMTILGNVINMRF